MTPRRVISSIAVAATAVALLAGCGGSGTAQPTTPTGTSSSASAASSSTGLKIDNFAFSPATLMVSGDARVDVTNDDSTAHTVTANDGKSFDTGPIDPGSSSRLSALKPGRYPYHCSIHSFMHGTLVVS